LAQTKAELLREIKKLQSELNQIEALGNAVTEKDIKLQETLRSKIVEQAKAIKELNAAKLSQFSAEESSIKSMSSIYGELNKSQVDGLSQTYSGQNKNIDSALKIMQVNRSIAQLSPDDEFARLQLMHERNALMNSLDKRSRGLVAHLQTENQLADNFANMSEDAKKALEMQHAAAEKLKESMQAISETIQTMVSRLASTRGIVGGLMVGAGKVLKNFSNVNKELGQVGDYTDGAAFNASLMSFAFSDAAGNLKALSAEMGGTEKATFGAQLQTNLMANNLGISGQEAATLSGSLARLNGGSLETAGNLSDAARNLAKANNIPVAQMMGDVAGSAEEFALFGKEGGTNILQAAGAAAKLGTNMKTLSGIADGLLDFESSITKELELGAMLGKNINLNKARQLAYDGDIAGAAQETLKQLGGIDEFNKMDYYQKKQTADLLGVSVAEFQKMATNQEQAAKMSKLMNGDFSNMGESLKAIVAQAGPKMMDWGGKFLMLSSQANQSWQFLGGSLKGIGQKAKGLLSKLKGGGGAIAESASGAAGGAGGGGVADKLNKTSGGKGMNVMNMVKGAAAILILSAALFVAAKAFQEFGSVTWSAVAMGLVGLAGMAAIAMVLGKVTGQLIQGSIAIALLGLALVPFAYSMKMMADIGIGQFATIAGGLILLSAAAAVLGFAIPFIAAGAAAIAILGAGLLVFGAGALVAGKGLEVFGGAASMISEMVPQITQMVGLIGPMAVMIPIIAGLAGAFGLLGLALGFLGIAGLPGLVVLAGIAALAGPITKLASVLGLGGDESSTETTAVEEDSLSGYQSQMLQKMDMLIQTTAGTRDVYLDKDKVTNVVMERAERGSGNVFGLGVA
jgi:hypothetical protein